MTRRFDTETEQPEKSLQLHCARCGTGFWTMSELIAHREDCGIQKQENHGLEQGVAR
jgi:hypothetical protein